MQTPGLSNLEILSYVALFGGPDMLRCGAQQLDLRRRGANVLTQPTPLLSPAWPVRADLESRIGSADPRGAHLGTVCPIIPIVR